MNVVISFCPFTQRPSLNLLLSLLVIRGTEKDISRVSNVTGSSVCKNQRACNFPRQKIICDFLENQLLSKYHICPCSARVENAFAKRLVGHFAASLLHSGHISFTSQMVVHKITVFI